jgi:hypothetical protein
MNMTDFGGFDLNEVEEIIVVVRHHDQFHWFKGDRDLWVLDWNKWKHDFIDAGITDPHDASPDERFGIRVVNEHTADKFLTKMQPFAINKADLAEELTVLFPDAQSWWDLDYLFPIMFVDFDRKHVCAFYPEGTRMERYIPDGWTSEFEDFATKYSEEHFPRKEKFWVRDGLDMLKELNERGRRLGQQQQ